MNKFPIGTVSGKCVDLSFEGKGVFKSENGDVIFVSGMFPGEEGKVEIEYKRNGALFGKVVSLASISKDRIEPRCKIATSCGGCCFQQYSYQAQLLFKKKKVEEQFRKIAHMDVVANPTIGMANPYFYRNKIQMPFGKDAKGNIYCGFYKSNTHAIVPVDVCYIESEKAEHILSSVKALMKKHKIEPYQEDRRFGVIRHVLIRTSFYTEDIMVVLVTAVDSFPGRNNFVKELSSCCPEITTIVQNINTRDTNVILGEKERVLKGKGYIEDSLCSLKFLISSKSFYQTNPVITEKLYEYAMKSWKISKNDTVFDAYSGIGTIGLIASKYAKEVISVELVKEAVKDGIKNAKNNGINNFRIYCDDASSFISSMAKGGEHLDVLFMDPPRKGSDKRFLDAVIKLKPDRIVYVSCDPSTLARDVSYLSQSYKIDDIQPFDMFPMTFHVETVVSLSRVSR